MCKDAKAPSNPSAIYGACISFIVAKHLLLKFNLTSANIIYSSGGKFFMLAPAAALVEIPPMHAVLERECYNQFDGAISMGLAGILLSGNDFSAEVFAQKWSAVSKACNLTKQCKFASLITDNFSTVFGVKGIGEEKPTCDSCRQEESPKNKLEVQFEGTIEERKICQRCLRMEKLGRQLARAKYLVEVVNEPERSDEGDLVRLQPLKLDRNHQLTYYLVPEEQPPLFKGDAVTYFSFELQAFNEKHALVQQLQAPEVQCGWRFYGGNDVPRDEDGEPLEYDDLANASGGLKRLGVLRMDVDNLGEVFRIGLGQNASPARVMALSWHLNYFFSYRLNQLRDQKEYMNHILVIYSGGDDLFIVGSWDRVVEFAVKIRDEFRSFASNPQLTISGGVAIVPRKFPIHKAADFSGEAEEAAKQLDDGAKNAFTLLDKPLRWSYFDLANSIRRELQQAIEAAPNGNGEAPPLNKGIIDRLRRIYGLYDENCRRKSKWPRETPAQIENYLDALRYDKWRWMLTYSLWRYRSSNKKYENLIQRLQEALINNKWIDQDGNAYPTKRDVIGFIDVPTRWVEFLTRKETENHNP
jgi:CRISPR-associated protein Csm1